MVKPGDITAFILKDVCRMNIEYIFIWYHLKTLHIAQQNII